MAAIDSLFSSFLEEEPKAAFFGTLQQRGMLDTHTRQRQASDIYNQAMQGFYGQLGAQVLGGEAPTLTFTDYLQQFPFTERFAQLGRSFNQSNRFSPRTRFLYY